jgi:hypothetical protein
MTDPTKSISRGSAVSKKNTSDGFSAVQEVITSEKGKDPDGMSGPLVLLDLDASQN